MFFFLVQIFKIHNAFYTYSTSQNKLATFQMLSGHTWLVATISASTGPEFFLNYELCVKSSCPVLKKETINTEVEEKALNHESKYLVSTLALRLSVTFDSSQSL